MTDSVSFRFQRLAVVAAVALSLLATAGCSARRAEQHRKTGDTYLQLNRLDDATREYDRALDLDPKNAGARFGQGVVLLRQKKPAEALAAFRQAVEAQPSFEPAYLEATRLLLNDKKIEEAEALARQLQGVNADSGGLMLAGIYLETGRTADAVKFLEERKAASADNVAVRVALAKAYLAAGQAEQAEAELKSLADAGGESTLAARMALVELYHAQGKLDSMVEETRRLVEERPEDPGLKLVLARGLLEKGDFAEARKMAEPVLIDSPDSPWANFIIGSCYLGQGAAAEAIPYLETAARKLPQQPAVERQLALARAGVSQSGGAKTEQAAATEQAPAAPAEAEAGAEEAPATAAASEASWQALWQSAQLGTLVDNRERFLSAEPDNVLLRETVALSALFAGRGPIADEVAQGLPADSPAAAYVKAVNAKDLKGALAALAPWKEGDDAHRVLERNATGNLLATAGLRAQALLTFSEVGRNAPDNAAFLYNLARMYRAARMPEFAAGALNKLLSVHPDNVEARQILFQVHLENDNIKQAKSVAENMYGLYPERRESVLSLAHAYTVTGQPDLASEILERSLAKHPEDAAFQLGLASVRLVQGRTPDALDLATKAQADTPPLERMRRQALALAKASQNDWPGVLALIQEIDAASMPPVLRLLAAAAHAAADRPAEAAGLIVASDGSVPADPNVQILVEALGKPVDALTPSQRNLASALAAQSAARAQYAYGLACLEAGLPNAANEAFGRVSQIVGEQPSLVTVRLAALGKLPDSPEKLERCRALAQEHADLSEAWVALGTLLQDAEDAAGAREALDKAAVLAPNNTQVWLRRSVFAEWQKDRPMALEAYRRLVELVPSNPAYHNNLAYCLLETDGDVSAAMREAQTAFDALPGNPSVLHTLGVAQLRSGDAPKARETLRDAVERRPGDPTVLLDYGKALVATGAADEGRRHAAMALQCADLLQLDFPRRAEAEALVNPQQPQGAPTTEQPQPAPAST